jgi:alginate O-acetyltransferase complex protein AlgI
MNVSSIEFVVPVLVGAAIFFYLPTVAWRQIALAAANLATLYLLLPNARLAACLAVFLGSGYLVARVLAVRPSRWLLGTYLFLLIAAFLVLQQYEVVTVLLPAALREHPIRIVGLSYMLFRQIHFLVDVMQDQTGPINLWTYANYQLNLFGILAGPIQRYQQFREQWDSLEPVLNDRHAVLRAGLRLFVGVLKIALVAPYFYNAWHELSHGLIAAHVAGWKYAVQFLVVFYFYPVYLYFNFSGYCDIVIAANSLFGIRLPENFDRPYLARNVLEFWTRWHITLGLWIRDYLFMAMYKPIAERWPKRAPSLAFLCYFFAFVLAGVWHGSTLNFLVYGLWQGVGASAGKLWESRLLRRGGRSGLRAYLQRPGVRLAAIAGNLHFQCLALVFFSLSVEEAFAMLRNLSCIVH